MLMVNHLAKGPILKITFKIKFIVMVSYIKVLRSHFGSVNGNNVFSKTNWPYIVTLNIFIPKYTVISLLDIYSREIFAYMHQEIEQK